MNIIQTMSAFGIPTIFAIVCWLTKMIINQGNRLNILMKAQQAQMRQGLMDKYYLYVAKGWVSRRDLDDWETAYQAYHKLADNGVLDARRDELFKLPSTPNYG